jgi:hypothetical protein
MKGAKLCESRNSSDYRCHGPPMWRRYMAHDGIETIPSTARVRVHGSDLARTLTWRGLPLYYRAQVIGRTHTARVIVATCRRGASGTWCVRVFEPTLTSIWVGFVTRLHHTGSLVCIRTCTTVAGKSLAADSTRVRVYGSRDPTGTRATSMGCVARSSCRAGRLGSSGLVRDKTDAERTQHPEKH